jgi:hypothetical protein
MNGGMKKQSRKLLKSEIVVNLPHSVELTRRTTNNALDVGVWVSGSKRGTLTLAQGSVTWKTSGKNSVTRRFWWKDFIPLLERMKRKRA